MSVFGYSTSSQVGTINFVNIESGLIYLDPITLYDNQVPIKQLTISEENLLVTFKDCDKVVLFKVAEDEIKYFMDIDSSFFPAWLAKEMGSFNPSLVKIGLNRLIFILSDQYILIMRLTTLDATYIDRILLPVSGLNQNIDLKVYRSTLTVVVGEQGLVF